MNFKLFQREPTLWLAFIYAVLTVIGTGGLANFTGQQAMLTNAAIAAVVGAINAYAVRPISPVSFTYALAAIAQLAAAYGILIPEATLTALNGLVVPALALLSRGQVSPANTAIFPSRISPDSANRTTGRPHWSPTKCRTTPWPHSLYCAGSREATSSK
jgi:hypothetical protein